MVGNEDATDIRVLLLAQYEESWVESALLVTVRDKVRVTYRVKLAALQERKDAGRASQEDIKTIDALGKVWLEFKLDLKGKDERKHIHGLVKRRRARRVVR